MRGVVTSHIKRCQLFIFTVNVIASTALLAGQIGDARSAVFAQTESGKIVEVRDGDFGSRPPGGGGNSRHAGSRSPDAPVAGAGVAESRASNAARTAPSHDNAQDEAAPKARRSRAWGSWLFADEQVAPAVERRNMPATSKAGPRKSGARSKAKRQGKDPVAGRAVAQAGVTVKARRSRAWGSWHLGDERVANAAVERRNMPAAGKSGPRKTDARSKEKRKAKDRVLGRALAQGQVAMGANRFRAWGSWHFGDQAVAHAAVEPRNASAAGKSVGSARKTDARSKAERYAKHHVSGRAVAQVQVSLHALDKPGSRHFGGKLVDSRAAPRGPAHAKTSPHGRTGTNSKASLRGQAQALAHGRIGTDSKASLRGQVKVDARAFSHPVKAGANGAPRGHRDAKPASYEATHDSRRGQIAANAKASARDRATVDTAASPVGQVTVDGKPSLLGRADIRDKHRDQPKAAAKSAQRVEADTNRASPGRAKASPREQTQPDAKAPSPGRANGKGSPQGQARDDRGCSRRGRHRNARPRARKKIS
jgi:hypothetical protein